ncbi:putative golgin subfamily A member 4 [Apostichopus japonicus]|uniref:Putative golgin subfamily A member 4 n=1 Tax=Stichopus japonicus TaxID=307972 RepID=A0A2G8JCP2_STIJA|nr:putative golgin subfamily A member 4 [Apostichopus japonicus]
MDQINVELEETKRSLKSAQLDVEAVKKDLENKTTDFEERFKLQQENFESEVSRKVEAAEIQKQSSVDEVSKDLGLKLEEALNSLRQKEQQLQDAGFKERELEQAMDALKNKLEGELNSANEVIQAERQRSTEKVDQVTATLRLSQEENEKYVEQLRSQGEELKDCALQSERMKEELDKLRSDLKSKQEEVGDKLEILEKELVEKREALAEAGRKHAEVQAELENKEGELEVLRQNSAALEQTLEAVRESHNEQLAQEKEELRKGNGTESGIS